ncbi:ribulose-phosphate 3-epimerase [Candidatus Dependentiae bacterium]|nr:ribulose-phosphate 3-epimerase [Candidatus Dependentiae bacterium]
MLRIFPSLMAADQLHLGQEVALLDAHCSGFHLDIMDGHFVPNIIFGPVLANAVDRASRNPSWIHLMVDNPSFFIERLTLKAKGIVSFHIESNFDFQYIISQIKEKKLQASLAIKPKTRVEKLFDFLNPMIDHVLIMSVEPGFSGQKFLPEVLQKIPVLQEYCREHQLSCSIGLDGGIVPALIPEIKRLGVDHIAASSSIFNYDDRIEALERLRE